MSWFYFNTDLILSKIGQGVFVIVKNVYGTMCVKFLTKQTLKYTTLINLCIYDVCKRHKEPCNIAKKINSCT